MRITVLVTAYNLENYLSDCLDSVLRQTEQPFEVLVVDDASTDGTAAIAKAYCQDREGWHYLRPEQNLGVLRATVYGLVRASGEVVCFLDGDDLWVADKLACVRARFAAQPDLRLLSHGYLKVDAQGQLLKRQNAPDIEYMTHLVGLQPERVDSVMREGILSYSGLVWLGSAWSLRLDGLRLEQFQCTVQQLPDAQFTYQDHLLATHTVLLCSGRCDWLPQPLLHYRLHGANFSGDTRSLERARLTVRKGLLTRQATFDLLERHSGQLAHLLKVHGLRLREMKFMDELYARHYLQALRHFWACFWKLWNGAERLKESLRLLGCLLFGPEGFLLVKGWFV